MLRKRCSERQRSTQCTDANVCTEIEKHRAALLIPRCDKIRPDRYRASTLNTNTHAVQYFSTEGGQGVNTVCVSRGLLYQDACLSDYAAASVRSSDLYYHLRRSEKGIDSLVSRSSAPPLTHVLLSPCRFKSSSQS